MKERVPGVAYENGDKALGRSDGSDRPARQVQPGSGRAGLQRVRFGQVRAQRARTSSSTSITRRTAKTTTDRSKVGFVFAKPGWKPTYRYFVHNGPLANNLAIPAYDSNAEVVAELTTQQPMKLAYMQPHMHLRGKDFELRLIFPSGETRTVLKGKWDFNWHLGYDLTEPIDLPVGTRIISICHYDNSAGQQGESGPEQAGVLGRPELGRDAEHLHRRPGGPEPRPADVLQGVGAESAAARRFRADALDVADASDRRPDQCERPGSSRHRRSATES